LAGRRHSHRSYNPGLERAQQHIREAKDLSRELGGTDEDVKRYFFGLSSPELRHILDEYEREHGKAAREYAETTIPAWRSGSRKMSGQNAARLFKLLPKFMPLKSKYALVESLWEKLAPQSEYSIAFGRNADGLKVGEQVAQRVTATINGHTIPDGLQRRFKWIAEGDAKLMQELLNYFLIRDRQQAIEAVGAEVALILLHARDDSAVQGFRRELKVGGHTVHIFLDPRATEVKLSPGSPRYRGAADYSWIGWVGFIVGIIVLILLFKGK
jgi:hypothetical protein